MKHLMTVLALSVACLSTTAFAADAAPGAAAPMGKQQSKMADCNKDAADKKGDDRKAFMKTCLSNKPAPEPKKMSQQEKMKACNKDAADKKGDDRKAFMKDCLSSK
jgi:hypothetical protein